MLRNYPEVIAGEHRGWFWSSRRLAAEVSHGCRIWRWCWFRPYMADTMSSPRRPLTLG
ncbi:hypothetical protein MA16_Dca007212 [Dendrobium catenatum]|uniref:Uncharacterized protein n=1 Tax=Dendrobium catenatum TaxID=906689 RepID=A0A2I0W6D4_9ASPA|nr:hypothetical protein MA16_Dca007212 [Dendrobium catenatum]